MQLAFSTNAYLRCSFAEAVQRLARIGYQGVEVTADVPHAWPAGLLDEQLDAMRDELARNSLQISNVNGFMMKAIADARQPYWHPSWIEDDRHYRQVRVDHTVRCLSLARRLGAHSVSTEPGGPLPARASWNGELKTFVQELKPVLEHAEKQGLSLLVEPEPGLLIETSEQFLELAGRLDSPAFGLNFDIGHFFCVGEDPAQAVTGLARYIRHVHLEDIPASRAHQHLIPGDGVIDLAAVCGALRSAGYDGWVTVELYPYVNDPDAAARTALERMSRILQGT
jgi:sugar phosphate isomerase/epimerase